MSIEPLNKLETATYQLIRDNYNMGVTRYEKSNPHRFFKQYGFKINTLKRLEEKGMVNVATINITPWGNSRQDWTFGVFIEISFE